MTIGRPAGGAPYLFESPDAAGTEQGGEAGDHFVTETHCAGGEGAAFASIDRLIDPARDDAEILSSL